jgi:hypothetical protein
LLPSPLLGVWIPRPKRPCSSWRADIIPK